MGGVVASNKALDVALKQVKVLAPETPAIFFRRRHWLQPGICQRPSVSCQHSPGCWTWNPGGIKIRELVRIIPYWYFMFQDQAETFDEVVQHSDSPGQCDCSHWWCQVVWEGGGGCDEKAINEPKTAILATFRTITDFFILVYWYDSPYFYLVLLLNCIRHFVIVCFFQR